MTKNFIKESLSGWGGFPRKIAKVFYPVKINQILNEIKNGEVIARGNGRAYGDSAISEKNTINMKNFNNILAFDEKNGILTIEAGVLLSDIIKTFLPRGWFPHVTPGSKYVTVGGMIAADVHGKNHHKDGSFSNFVEWIEVIDHDGKINRCSKEGNKELFEWTIGGMGLTGIIIRAAIKLRAVETCWIKQKTLTAKNIDETLEIFKSSMNSTYSVAWLNCSVKNENIGQSLIMLGEHAAVNELKSKDKDTPLKLIKKKKLYIPFYLPNWFLNKWFISLFNFIYYSFGKILKKDRMIYWDKYFYPLDNLLGWNKIYGRKGLIQYQCVFPLIKSKDGLLEIIKEINKSKVCPFLTVLKQFGKQQSKFSFPMEGLTIALDFPVNSETLKLLEKLDEITLKYKGRVYLAKDSRMKKEIFQKSDTRIKDYLNFRNKNNSKSYFSSSQSTRLGL